MRPGSERKRPPRLFLFVLLFAFLLLGGCGRDSVYRREAFVFGTRVEVLIYGPKEDRARDAADSVLQEFDRLHRMLHAWKPSELTALNGAIARGEREIPVSPELASILRDAQDLAARSDQLFNPAIGAMVALWGFQDDEFRAALPDAGRLARLVAARPAMSDLELAPERVTSRNPAVQLDLGGYAKGYALDRAKAILRAKGIADALINIGGNILALGSKGEQPWRVGIQDSRGPIPIATLALRDGEAIGTSGDYQRFFELDGKRYCHLIDPRTGHPARSAQAVTVLVTPRPDAGVLSDVASKPMFIADVAHWREYARRLQVQHALRIDADGRIVVTRAFYSRLAIAPQQRKPVVID